MAPTEDVLADYVERLFETASRLSVAVTDGSIRRDASRLAHLQSLATELEFGLGMVHDRLTERHELA
ncbi:MAG TPA: hypothetical protein VIG37_02580 [Methylomirabilota bacterium]|jgi:hypothetical protein